MQNKIVIDPRDFPNPKHLYRYIKQLTNCHVVIAQPQEFAPVSEHIWKHQGFRRAIEQLLKNNNVTVEYWLGNFEEEVYPNLVDAGIDVKCWPMYWAYRTKELLVFDSFKPDMHKDKLFVSLNNRAHSHRCMLIDKIYQKGLQNHSLLSWIDPDGRSRDFDFQYFNGAQLCLDEPINPDDRKPYHQYIPPVNYHSALFALISESSVFYKDISEKTFTAIFYKQPFLIQGAPGIHQVLKDHGFELYTECFDYEFDSVDDLDHRTNMILDQLSQYVRIDYNKMYADLKDKIEHNHQHLNNIATSAEYVPKELSQHMPEISVVFPDYIARNPSKYGL